MLELRLGGAKDAQDSIARLVGVTNDLDIQKIWPELVNEVIHPWFLEAAAKNLLSQGRLVGENWNYSGEPKYAAYKMEQVGHNDVLRWEKGGTYERLFPSLTDSTHKYHYFRVTNNSVSIGTSVEYAQRLTTGGEGPFGEPYPGRSLLPSSGSLNKRLMTEIQRFIKNKLASKGRRIGSARFNL